MEIDTRTTRLGGYLASQDGGSRYNTADLPSFPDDLRILVRV
jgi:hypothetical protein